MATNPQFSPKPTLGRLDQYLTARYPAQSRAAVQRWIREGRVTVNGASVTKTGFSVEPGMEVTVDVPAAPEAVESLQAQEMALDILYEDDDILVVNKPAGMVVHPAPGHQDSTLVNAVLHHAPALAGVGGERRPGIVHRLDMETSGVIVVAKNDAALRNVQAQFKARTVHKEYLTVIEGGINPPDGVINAPTGRSPNNRKRQAVLPADPETGEGGGREAITEYHTLATYHALGLHGAGRMTFTYLRIVLHTGRTHQIRVHLAWRKHPVLGDTLYGPRKPRLPVKRTLLHAHKLRLRLPSSGEAREFVAPLPDDFVKILTAFEEGNAQIA